uniref:Uncharacterized protein n=1 Tax=Arundo donax TaxID=35708 RepID=A0A0A8XRD9_ARUDO
MDTTAAAAHLVSLRH